MDRRSEQALEIAFDEFEVIELFSAAVERWIRGDADQSLRTYPDGSRRHVAENKRVIRKENVASSDLFTGKPGDAQFVYKRNRSLVERANKELAR